RMPGMDGTQTLHVLREKESCRINHDTPVVLLTADAFAGVREEALANGFNGYLSKPVTPADLSGALREFLPAEKILAEGEDHPNGADSAGTEAAARQVTTGNVNENEAEDNSLLSILARKCGLAAEKAAESMGNEELYTSVLTDFTALGDANADEIERLRAAGDIENYTVKVHALKSSARLIGAMDISARAKALEDAGDRAREGDTDARSRIDSDTGELLEDYRELLKKLSGVLREKGLLPEGEYGPEGGEESEGGADLDKPEIEASDLEEAYGVILEMADALDPDGVQFVLKSLSGYRLPEAEVEKIRKISALVREVNFSGIRETLKDTANDGGDERCGRESAF
ncbi:MAG: response regulator, partial [Lachnospiraceae bacterium]|nr:response regulator [Lachnospiraceae bacterium]